MNKANGSITAWYARLSFPTLWEPKAIMLQGKPTGDPKYSCNIVIPNDSFHADTIKAIQAEEERLLAIAWPNGVPQNARRALQWGPTAHPKDANLADCWVMHAYAKADSPPQVGVYHPDTKVFDAWTRETGQSRTYSGAEAHVSCGLYAYEYSSLSLGLGVGLNMVWLTERPMPRFDSRQTPDTAFGDGPSGNAPPALEGAPPPAPPLPGDDDIPF